LARECSGVSIQDSAHPCPCPLVEEDETP